MRQGFYLSVRNVGILFEHVLYILSYIVNNYALNIDSRLNLTVEMEAIGVGESIFHEQ